MRIKIGIILSGDSVRIRGRRMTLYVNCHRHASTPLSMTAGSILRQFHTPTTIREAVKKKY